METKKPRDLSCLHKADGEDPGDFYGLNYGLNLISHDRMIQSLCDSASILSFHIVLRYD